MKTKVEIEVDVPEGFELTGEIRPPMVGEWFLTNFEEARVCEADYAMRRLILRKVEPPAPAWEWPEWLTAEWICINPYNEGHWFMSNVEPIASESGGWHGWNWKGNQKLEIDLSLFAFTPPPVTDWRESKRRNPKFVEAVKRETAWGVLYPIRAILALPSRESFRKRDGEYLVRIECENGKPVAVALEDVE